MAIEIADDKATEWSPLEGLDASGIDASPRTRPRIAPSSRSAAKTGWERPMSHGGVAR